MCLCFVEVRANILVITQRDLPIFPLSFFVKLANTSAPAAFFRLFFSFWLEHEEDISFFYFRKYVDGRGFVFSDSNWNVSKFFLILHGKRLCKKSVIKGISDDRSQSKTIIGKDNKLSVSEIKPPTINYLDWGDVPFVNQNDRIFSGCTLVATNRREEVIKWMGNIIYLSK